VTSLFQALAGRSMRPINRNVQIVRRVCATGIISPRPPAGGDDLVLQPGKMVFEIRPATRTAEKKLD